MKLSLFALGALAASATASPVHIILTGPPSNIGHSPNRHVEQPELIPFARPRPCGEKYRFSTAGSMPGPLGALLSRLGLFPRPVSHDAVADLTASRADETEEGISGVADVWRHRVEEMIEGARKGMGRGGRGKELSILEGGVVRVLPLEGATGEEKHGWRAHGWHHKEHAEEGEHEHGHHRHHGHHEHEHEHEQGGEGHHRGPGHGRWHHRPHSFGGRLHRALHNLRPAEALALAFVLGTGIGSILHFFFMLFLLTVRRCRMGRQGRRECRKIRKEARKARRDARKAAKAAGQEGRVRLEGEDVIVVCGPAAGNGEGEALPRYEEGGAVVLEEKA